MLLKDFDYELPQELIAQKPLAKRSDSRLLCLDKKTGAITHYQFKNLPNLLSLQDLLVLNNTKVIPARLYGHKATGGKVEIMIERVLENNQLLAQTKTSKSLKGGERVFLDEENYFEVVGRKDNLFVLVLNSVDNLGVVLDKFGNIPLPPYIKRGVDNADQENYQTIYAKHSGAVAAPTAGLHFDQELVSSLEQKNINSTYITLHVGLGTYQPVRVKKIAEHKIHPEYIEVSKKTCEQIIQTKAKGSKVIAVGTTTIRALESASKSDQIKPYQGDTNIFIYPGYEFKCVDVLITNFHLPKTSLLILIASFAGYENTMRAYEEAIREKYRFYSYGDAMIII